MKKIVILFAALLPMLSWAQYDLLRPATRTDVGLNGPVYQVVSTIHSIDDDSCWARTATATYSFGGMLVAGTDLDLATAGNSVEHYYYAGNKLTSCEMTLPNFGANGEVAYSDVAYRLEYNEMGRLDKMITYFQVEDYTDSVVAKVQCNVKGYPQKLVSATDTFEYAYARTGKLSTIYHFAKDKEVRTQSLAYDDEGRIVREQVSGANGPLCATIYSYNDKGYPQHKAITTWDPATKVTYDYTYTGNVDQFGNWLSRHVTITTNGKAVHCYEVRAMVYYK